MLNLGATFILTGREECLTRTAKPFNKVFVGPTNLFVLAENTWLLPFKQKSSD